MINVPRTFNNFPGGRYMFLDKFDIFVFRHRASRRAQRWCKIDAHDRESRCRADKHTYRHRVYFLYEPLWRCVRRPSRRSSVLLPFSLCAPYPFFCTSMTSLLPLPQSPGHTSTQTAIYLRLSPSLSLFPAFSLAFASFSFSFLSLTLLLSLSQKESRIWQRSIHPCPYSHDPAISTAPARFSHAHMDWRIHKQRLRESKKEREEEEGCVKCEKARRKKKQDAGEGTRDVLTMKKKNKEARWKERVKEDTNNREREGGRQVDNVVYIRIEKLWSRANGWRRVVYHTESSWHTGEKVRQINDVSTITYSKIRRNNKKERKKEFRIMEQ